MPFLRSLLLGDNIFFFFFLLLGLLPGLNLALLLPKDPFNLFRKAKSFQSLVFIKNSFGQFLLPHLLDVILIYQRSRYVPSNVNFHCLQVDNTKVFLFGNESSCSNDGLLGVLAQSFEDIEYLVIPKDFVDEGVIVDVVHSSQGLHVPQNIDVDSVWKVERDLIHQMEEHKFVQVKHKVF